MQMNYIEGVSVRACDMPEYGRIGIWVRHAFDPNGSARMSAPEPMVFKEVEPGAMVNPICMIDRSAAQALADSLWDAGIRPTRASDDAGALKATERHLEDMRKLAMREE